MVNFSFQKVTRAERTKHKKNQFFGSYFYVNTEKNIETNTLCYEQPKSFFKEFILLYQVFCSTKLGEKMEKIQNLKKIKLIRMK